MRRLEAVKAAFHALCPTAKGTPRWWEVTVNPIRNSANGPVVRNLSDYRDRTGDQKREDVLRQLAADRPDAPKCLSVVEQELPAAQDAPHHVLQHLALLGFARGGDDLQHLLLFVGSWEAGE